SPDKAGSKAGPDQTSFQTCSKSSGAARSENDITVVLNGYFEERLPSSFTFFHEISPNFTEFRANFIRKLLTICDLQLKTQKYPLSKKFFPPAFNDLLDLGLVFLRFLGSLLFKVPPGCF